MSEVRINIVAPERASGDRDVELVELAELICKTYPERYGDGFHGILGGQYGYGENYVNAVFAMRTYYWGDCTCGWNEMEFGEESHPHADTCYQTLVRRELVDVHGWQEEWWGATMGEDIGYQEGRAREDAVMRRHCEALGLPFPNGAAIHCTCERQAEYEAWYEANKKGPNGHAVECAVVLPNFVHLASGLEARWYKWIGRSMEWNRDVPDEEWEQIMRECRESVRA